MKKYLSYITAALFLSLLVFASCGGEDGDGDGDGDGTDNVLDGIAESLVSGTMVLDEVTKPADATELDWTGLEVTFSGNADGGTYTTTGSADATVWPASGTWTFNNDSGTELLRDDETVVDLAISLPDVNLQFTINTTSERTGVIDGQWEWDFTVQ